MTVDEEDDEEEGADEGEGDGEDNGRDGTDSPEGGLIEIFCLLFLAFHREFGGFRWSLNIECHQSTINCIGKMPNS